MKKTTLLISLLALLCVIFTEDCRACTSAIISGRLTPDGRPLLWKHRDTGELNNRVDYIARNKNVKYAFIAVVNAAPDEQEAWMGTNETGFSIINTASSNMNQYKEDSNDQEGVVMYKALACCRTLADFEAFLEKNKPLGVETNFGVIDAYGGAAYYETGNYRYVKFDANEAPGGIIIRTNYSESYDKATGWGFCRFGTAREAIDEALAAKNLTPRFLFNTVARSLKHSLTQTDLMAELPESADKPAFKFFTDYISRHSTSSALLIVGAKNAEMARAATMWTTVGFPLTTAVVPIWLDAASTLPATIAMRADLQSPLCVAGMTLKERCFSLKYGNYRNYIDLAQLVNKQQTGIMQRLVAMEGEIFDRAIEVQTALEKGKRGADGQVAVYYRWLDAYLVDAYRRTFGVELL